MKALDTLLTIANVIFLTATVVEVRHSFSLVGEALPPPLAATGDTLVLTFYAVIFFALVGVIKNVYALIVAYQRATLIDSDSAHPITTTPWQRAHTYVSLFIINEFIFKALISTGNAVAWELPNATGRIRLVYPLRYLCWASTNSYIFTAVSIAFGLKPVETFISVLGIIICTVMAFPLELHPIASPIWLFAAIISTSAFFVCITATLRRALVLYPLASKTEASILVIIMTAVFTSYLAFPVVFYVAVICGGDGEGLSCLTNAQEAEAWIVLEGLAKISIYILTIIGSMITTSCTSAHALSLTQVQPRAIKMHALPQKYATQSHAAHLTWTSVLFAHTDTLVAAPLLTGAVIYVIQDTLLAVIALKFVSDDIMEAIITIKYASGSIAVLAALSVFFVALDSVIRTENLRSLVLSIIPAGFINHTSEEVEWDIGSAVFSMPTILYVDEAHVTVLFADIVGFTPASAGIAPNIVKGTVGSLFRHFDQLHAAAGAVKVETSGDAYMSVMGASSMGFSDAVTPDAATQASKMATLALDLIEASREHKWPNGTQIQVRVGIHCGPATSGVLGGMLPRWAVFGTTVVLASRMESTGEASRVQVTSAFANMLNKATDGTSPHNFTLTDRDVNVKGMGVMRTHFLGLSSSGSSGHTSSGHEHIQ